MSYQRKVESSTRLDETDGTVDVRTLDDEQVLELCRTAKLDVYDKFVIQ